MGNPPSVGLIAILSGSLPFISLAANASKKYSPDSGSVRGSLVSGPAMTDINKIASLIERAIGPVVDNLPYQPNPGFLGVLPIEGRNPTTLQKLAGLLSEPPIALPAAKGSIFVAKAAAAPPLLPPALRLKS